MTNESAMTKSGADILVRSLKDLGVRQVFGYTGAAILPVMDELARQGVQIIVNANEQSAAFAAAGFSRAGGGVGVAIVTSGPAITNTLTAVADAFADSIPLIVIAGQVPEHKIGTDSFQHIAVDRVFGPTAKKVVVIDNVDDIETAVKDAWGLARAGKPGPVVIDVPINLQKDSSNYLGRDRAFFEGVYEDESHLSAEQCRQFFALLTRARRPLLYLGGGLNNPEGSSAIRRFNERFQIPVVNTLMGKGVIDETGPDALGMLGMFGTPCPNMVIQGNDFFFALGVRWDDRVADKVGFAIQATIAYIDINPIKVRQIREERAPAFSVIGDAAIFLHELTDYAEVHDIRLSIDEWRQHCGATKRQWPLEYNRAAEALQQAEIVARLNELLPKNAIVTTGVGNHQMLAAQYLRMRSPRHFLTSGSFGTMGFGMPTAIGAHFASPDSTVIVIDGDGSLRMNLGELYTIGSQRLPIKVLLLNNLSDGMVHNLEDSAYGGRHSATLRQFDADFSAVARECGFAYSRRITRRDELDDAMQSFLSAAGPALLEARTDINEKLYPVVPAGCSYNEMVLGPYIKKIED